MSIPVVVVGHTQKNQKQSQLVMISNIQSSFNWHLTAIQECSGQYHSDLAFSPHSRVSTVADFSGQELRYRFLTNAKSNFLSTEPHKLAGGAESTEAFFWSFSFATSNPYFSCRIWLFWDQGNSSPNLWLNNRENFLFGTSYLATPAQSLC